MGAVRPLVVLAITLVGAIALAHVAPSVDDNNRYLKVTPQGDRVRIAYTVFFGEKPGSRMRPGIDRDHDGMLSDGEAQAFADQLAGEVAAALEVTVDGVTSAMQWSEAVPGLGSPRVAAGAFSIDLIAHLCLAEPRGRHRVVVRDRFRLTNPGETEVKVDTLPGVSIDAARVGNATAPNHDFRFIGPGGPLSDDGLDVTFTASDDAPLGTTACATPIATPSSSRRWAVVAAVAIGVAVVAVVVVAGRRRRRNAPSGV